MSSFVGLYTGLSGVRAAQTGIDVTSHNVANANTPGYTRQRVELIASHSYRSPVGWVGTGVTVDSIARLRDQFLDDRFRSAIGDRASAGVRAEFLASLEVLSGEPDLGLSGRITRLWAAAEAWSNDPADAASRRQVLTELASIAEGFRATAESWDRLGEDTGERRATVATVVTATLQNLHDLNRRIANEDPARIGNDIYDQRDLLLDQLSQLTGAVARPQADGSVGVTLGTLELLGPGGPASFAISADGSTIDITDPGGATTSTTTLVGGELGGLHRVLTVDLPQWRTALDELAVGLATAVNGVNQTAGGPALLAPSDPGAPAATLQLLTQDPAALIASTAGPGAPPHDGSNARRLADLRTTPVGFGTPPTARTIEAAHADLVVGLAGAVRSSRTTADAAGGVAVGAQLARAAEHGVSLDEEMVGLVRYQRALEAAARVMTTVDQALETLVNRVGIVGR
jgi:flagellar hook-associated protein 1 FlgK